MRTRAMLVVLLAALGTAPGAAAQAASDEVVDIPVAFKVANVDRSGVPCPTDLSTRTVRGHLTAPRRLLDAPSPPPVTLYLHSLSTGEWQWRWRTSPGVDYATEMARRGLASVTIDRLGYGASDRPHGMLLCAGGSADVVHQIVRALRSGTYSAAPGAAPRFGRVVVAGHSLGGLTAEVEAYSFKDVDGLILLGYADGGTNIQAADVVTGTAMFTDCLTTGYAHFAPPERQRQAFYGVPADITDAAMRMRSPDPCGELA